MQGCAIYVPAYLFFPEVLSWNRPSRSLAKDLSYFVVGVHHKAGTILLFGRQRSTVFDGRALVAIRID